jgi:hypothetical protein
MLSLQGDPRQHLNQQLQLAPYKAEPRDESFAAAAAAASSSAANLKRSQALDSHEGNLCVLSWNLIWIFDI